MTRPLRAALVAAGWWLWAATNLAVAYTVVRPLLAGHPLPGLIGTLILWAALTATPVAARRSRLTVTFAGRALLTAVFLGATAGAAGLVTAPAAHAGPAEWVEDKFCPDGTIEPERPDFGFRDVSKMPRPEYSRDEAPYANYGTAGLRWAIDDNGCGAYAETGVGNMLFDLAQAISNITQEVRGYALSPDLLRPFDPFFTQLTSGLRDSIWTPNLLGMLALAVLAVAVSLVSGKHSAVEGLIWIVVAVGGLTLILAQPMLLARAGDAAIVNAANATSTLVASAFQPAGTGHLNPATALNEAFHSGVSVQAFRAGQFDSPDTASRFADRDRWSKAFTVAEDQATAGDKAARDKLTKEKKAERKKIADEMKRDYPAAYAVWSGRQMNRTQTGLVALAAAVFSAPLIVMAAVGLLVAWMTLRFAGPFAATVGMLGLIPAMRGLLLNGLEMLIMAVVKAFALAAVLGVIVFAYGIALGPGNGLPWIGQILLLVAVQATVWTFRRTLWGVWQRGTHRARWWYRVVVGGATAGAAAELTGEQIQQRRRDEAAGRWRSADETPAQQSSSAADAAPRTEPNMPTSDRTPSTPESPRSADETPPASRGDGLDWAPREPFPNIVEGRINPADELNHWKQKESARRAAEPAQP